MNRVRKQALSNPERLVNLRRACCEDSAVDPSEQAALVAYMLASREVAGKLPDRLSESLLSEVQAALGEQEAS